MLINSIFFKLWKIPYFFHEKHLILTFFFPTKIPDLYEIMHMGNFTHSNWPVNSSLHPCEQSHMGIELVHRLLSLYRLFSPDTKIATRLDFQFSCKCYRRRTTPTTPTKKGHFIQAKSKSTTYVSKRAAFK